MDELDLLLTEDLTDLLEITGRIHAKGEDLDRLARIRRKLQRAIHEGLVGEFVKPLAPPAETAPPVTALDAEQAALAEQARDSAPAPVTG